MPVLSGDSNVNPVFPPAGTASARLLKPFPDSQSAAPARLSERPRRRKKVRNGLKDGGVLTLCGAMCLSRALSSGFCKRPIAPFLDPAPDHDLDLPGFGCGPAALRSFVA